jgi:hypothetical protein
MCSFIGRIRILFTKMSEESNKKIDKRGRWSKVDGGAAHEHCREMRHKLH